jgi:hypothetical protein
MDRQAPTREVLVMRREMKGRPNTAVMAGEKGKKTENKIQLAPLVWAFAEKFSTLLF